MNAMGQNLLSSITGNVPKAILCVRQMTPASAAGGLNAAIGQADSLQSSLLQNTSAALSGSFRSLTKAGGAMAGTGYLAMEVQYNPNTIYMNTQAGYQVQYSGGNLGSGSNNQIVQVNQPVSTIMSFQLIFDDMNPQDAFMLENIAPTAGNAISGVSNIVKKLADRAYSVQTQIDGLMSLLTQDETRQVVFYWARMSFRGELVSVSSRYTMFNKAGNPIRGVVDLSIRQGEEGDGTYWDQAFSKAFGSSLENKTSGAAGKLKQATQNNFLNLNL